VRTELKIVCLAPYVPHPRIPHAGGLYLYNYLEQLSRKHDVTLVAPSNGIDPGWDGIGCPVRVHVIDVGQRPRTVRSVVQRQLSDLREGLSPGPDVLAAFRRDPELPALLDSADVVDLQFATFLRFAPLVREHRPDVPLVCSEQDVATQVTMRAIRRGAPYLRLKSALTLGRLRRAEAAGLNLCNQVFIFNPDNETLLRTMGVRTPTHTVQPWVSRPTERAKPDSSRSGVLFVGAFDRAENVEGARWLLKHVWPAVRLRVPSATITLAGANPPKWFHNHAANGVTATGFVEDLEPFYRSAALSVAPLLRGAGIKVKVPQALMYGLPVVATTIGAEGVPVDGPMSFLRVENSPAAFAASIVDLLTNDNREQVSASASEFARSTFSFAASVEEIERRFRELVELRLSPHGPVTATRG
jgi:glycosyltransferase involved in cell wall biosynthesis